MSIRVQLLLLGLIGNLLIASVFSYTSIQRQSVQEEASGESLVILYESAWFQTYNSVLERMGRWEPNFGERGDVWDSDKEILQDMVETEGKFINPIIDSINSKPTYKLP